ncbi:hypothetical protein [Rhizobacter sp. LjRoot28]|jgi:hypothetical protein|uniref:hypothetical protein n=1 Tax=Rhizobacter sp. LjRoot28 TaxID=3342309 RepID=UPI003ECCC92F
MLSSLFGELRSLRTIRSDGHGPDDSGFAATALMESTATEVNDHGQMVDSHQSDLVVTGSAAQAIRDHFATTRADLDSAKRQITLLDPTGVWANAVIKALSDATGRPVEKLHLREQGTLRTLAVIERTTLARRNEDTVRIYHADVRAPGDDNAAVPLALMERSHMTAVIVGAMSPHAIDDMLAGLQRAVAHPNWRCPTLLFMLPPNAVWIANKIAMQEWPGALRVQILNEALTSASAVWNSLLSIWNHVKGVPTWQPRQAPNAHGLEGFPIKVADFARMPEPRPRSPLDPKATARALSILSGVEGLLGCALVDADTGFALARHGRVGPPEQLDRAAAASARLLHAHRQAAADLALADHVDEVMSSAGDRHHLLRSVAHHPGLFLFAVLDRQHTNLALARYKLMEAEQGL